MNETVAVKRIVFDSAVLMIGVLVAAAGFYSRSVIWMMPGV